MVKRILLLEKERNLAHFLSLELQKEQYRVDQVEEGQKALSMALQTDYDLILLNAHLGDMTAQDFADKLSRTKPASVIMVLDHREELQDQIETIQRFAVSVALSYFQTLSNNCSRVRTFLLPIRVAKRSYSRRVRAIISSPR